MPTGKWIVMSAAVLMTGSLLFAADDAMPPAAEAPPTHHRSKLIKPYSELSNLTDEQKSEISKAHADYLKQAKELLAKEKSDIEAILTDDQKAELKTLEEKGVIDKKEKAAQRREAKDAGGDATTQPTQ